jgi:hypothetical protein
MNSSKHLKKEICPHEIICLYEQWVVTKTTESHAPHDVFTQANKYTHGYVLTRSRVFMLQA